MAFRSQAFAALLMATTAAGTEFAVKHIHVRKDQPGVLTIDAKGIRYAEREHHYSWTWSDIQRLVLSPDRIELTTYKDIKWLAGRDERFSFKGMRLEHAYPLLRSQLPRRLIPNFARTDIDSRAKYPAKRLEGRGGHEGILLIGDDCFVFQSASRRGSHTWILDDVDNISSPDPLQLTITSLGVEYRLQLKQPMPDTAYNDLWRTLNLRSIH